MRFSAAVGRQVVGADGADTIGQVAGFVVDPVARRVIAVHVKKSGSGTSLPWSSISTFGDDAIIVRGAEAIGQPDEASVALTGKDHDVIGKRVLTSAGNELGTVEDVDFDPASGAITSLLLDRSDHSGDVAGTRLVGVGSYAAIVDAH